MNLRSHSLDKLNHYDRRIRSYYAFLRLKGASGVKICCGKKQQRIFAVSRIAECSGCLHRRHTSRPTIPKHSCKTRNLRSSQREEPLPLPHRDGCGEKGRERGGACAWPRPAAAAAAATTAPAPFVASARSFVVSCLSAR
jgi:hypothetical protein